jgi:DNA-binding CsgD family transcriptional regulator
MHGGLGPDADAPSRAWFVRTARTAVRSTSPLTEGAAAGGTLPEGVGRAEVTSGRGRWTRIGSVSTGPRPRLPPDYGRSGYASPLNDRSVDQLLRLVDDGASPREVAEKFQVTVRTVGRWRRLLGFTWISRPDPRHDRLRQLWRSDLTMRQLGEELDVSNTTVRRWARELGLRDRAPRRPASVESIVRPQIRRMVRQGINDEAIAQKLELAVSTVAAYRRRDGWIYRSGSAVDPAAIKGLFRKGLPDDEMATELGISVVTVRQHRHRLGLLRAPSRLLAGERR